MGALLVICGERAAIEQRYVPAIRGGGWRHDIEIVQPGDEPVDMARCAGLVLPGGNDIHPANWDAVEPVHPAAVVDAPRDALELSIARSAWNAGLPILGICRGIQALNVALGGSLIQHVPEYYGCPLAQHRSGSAGDPVLCHRVTVARSSRLATALDSVDVAVNSRHHQAVLRVAAELQAVAWDDGTVGPGGPLVEGLEARDPRRWALAVQWHPENLTTLRGDPGAAARNLFRSFVAALDAHG